MTFFIGRYMVRRQASHVRVCMRVHVRVYDIFHRQTFGQKAGITANVLAECAFALFRAAAPKVKEWPSPDMDIDACHISERVCTSFFIVFFFFFFLLACSY